jgi:peroxiredoxin Q/BCP
MKLLIGKMAPSFTLPSNEGSPISLQDYKGRAGIVYFYPKDGARGCTLEALEFKKLYYDFFDRNFYIIGIGPDSIASHCQFSKQNDLPFPLLSDIEHKVAELYGIWEQKTNYGKTYWGVERTSFVLDKNKIIRATLENKKPEEHAFLSLQALIELEKEF